MRSILTCCSAVVCHFAIVQDSKIHGQGLFTTNTFSGTKGSFIQMPLVGSFEVHDSVGDSIEAGKEDGLPRFLVSENMAIFLSEGEVARPKAGLYLVPHKTSPLFYMNSSCTDPDKENFQFSSVLKARDFRGVEDKANFLRKAPNAVLFYLACGVERDTELLAFYDLANKAVSR